MGMTQEEFYERYPQLRGLLGPISHETWAAQFSISPDAMHRIFADIIKQEYAPKGRVGQRPMPMEEDVNFAQFLREDFTDLPLHQALPKLMRVSQRAFAARCGMSKTQFRRVLSGELTPDPSQIRRIAQAARVSPLYFIEYRRMMLMVAVADLVEENTDILNTLVLRYVSTRVGE